MKYLRFGVLLGLGLLSVEGRSQQTDITKIEFNSLSRGGYHEQIIISPDTIKISKLMDRSTKENRKFQRKLSASEWSTLLVCLKNVSLTEIPELKSPTKNRAFDGAMHSSLIISTKNGLSWGHAFDDENPHEKLKLLMKTIREMTNKAANGSN